MTNENLIAVHRYVCQIPEASEIELGETLTFRANGILWEVRDTGGNAETPFILARYGSVVFGFTKPESIKKFFTK